MAQTKINTSSLPSNLSDRTPLTASSRTQLTTALLTSNAIPRIEAALSQELAACGWTTNLRSYITTLVRNGDCVTYGDVMKRVLAAIKVAPDPTAKQVANGDTGKVPDGSIAIPMDVVREGIKAVRAEVNRVCDVRVDDVDD